MSEPREAESTNFEYVADEVMAAIRELHERCGIDDVFDRRPTLAQYTVGMQTMPSAVHPRIVCDPQIVGGSPTIRGTRVPVRAIACLWRATGRVADIRRNYPRRSTDDVEAALQYYREHMAKIDEELLAEDLAED